MSDSEASGGIYALWFSAQISPLTLFSRDDKKRNADLLIKLILGRAEWLGWKNAILSAIGNYFPICIIY